MAGGRLLSKALAFSASSYPFPPPPLRRLSIAAVAGILDIDPPEPARRQRPTPPLASLSRSDSVLGFLLSRGLAAGDIAGFANRGLLDAKLDRDLAAKFDLLVGLGFSDSEVAKLLRMSNLLSSISLGGLKQRIEFLKSVVAGDGDVVRMIKGSIWTISGSGVIERRIGDNIAIMKEWGLADAKIKSLLVSHTRFFQLKPQSIVAAAERAQSEFGVARDAKMLFYLVFVLAVQPESTRQAKFRVLETFGWERSDVHALFRTRPLCFTLSADKLEKTLEFLMNRVGFSPSDIVNRGSMLGMSLEGRLSPRYDLINALKSKCLVRETFGFYSAAYLSEKDFQKKFVDKFVDVVPDACEAYMSRIALAAQKK